ncbi:PLP-dependent aminotransferase family protein [Paenibacillus sp. J5C_2022]|uniref:aminotransferase-like domain-containing protein n=1 Tax=Paenibacillus sp. J5C2022 TaxID=2977129 RepID=UPI0021D1717C|nr:PLP-dependent aminotransferase family protein [Paenibacillus sp. J5C2022]MCU6710008.1 PLP-dependent aminotransferase family protein [Paenibacillus sp. J5C2022]
MRKYEQVRTDLEAKITGGHFRPGEKLPSVRQASEQYSCSMSTITRAYSELEHRHLIYAVAQSGYYVVEKLDVSDRRQHQSGMIDFTSASPDVDVFPYLDFQHCLNQAIDTYKYNLFTYGDVLGLDSLRKRLSSHMAGHQVFAPPERIVVTSGAQQALEILARMPMPNGRQTILVEQPSYNFYLRYLEREGLPVRGITRTAEGIDLDELESIFRSGEVKLFYTMPRHHNPLGTTLSVAERKGIARLAGQYDVYVIEDDYMADLGGERDYDPIYAYNQSGHVVYVKSFSKIIFPGLRLGAAVLPAALMDVFQTYKSYGDTSLLSQAALDVYMKNGMYERHKHKIWQQYESRLSELHDAVAKFNQHGILEAAKVYSGVYVQFKLPLTVNLEVLTKRLADRGVQVVSGKDSYLSYVLNREKFLRISISRVQPRQIEEGVRLIVEEAGAYSFPSLN